MPIETGDEVEIEYVGRIQEGEVFDTSRRNIAEETGLIDKFPDDKEYSPLNVRIGEGQIIEGLEEGLIGLEKGETRKITVPPEKGYGEVNDEKIETYDISEFEQMLQGQTPQEGMRLQTAEGEIGTITKVDSNEVKIDFNHELSGRTIEFEIEVVDIN